MTGLAVVDNNSEKKSGDDRSTETGNQEQRRHLWYSKWKSLPHCSGRLMKLHCLHWSERVARTVTVMVRSTSFWPFSTTKYSNLQHMVGNLTSSSNIMFLCQLLIRGKAETTWQTSGRREAYQRNSHSQCSPPFTAVHIVVAVCSCPLWSIVAIFRDYLYLSCLYVVPHPKTSV